MSTTFASPKSEKLVLTAAVAVVIAGSDEGSITVHIPNGTTASVEMTCATDDEIQAASDANIWMPWAAGTKIGPYMDTLVGNVSALRITSAAGGTVYILRQRAY